MTKKIFNILTIFLSIIGIIPLAILGLLTPYIFVAFMLGISGVVFVAILTINSYELGCEKDD